MAALFGEHIVFDIPEEEPMIEGPQYGNPHMNTIEGLHLNTRRYKYDRDVMPDGVDDSETLGAGKNYQGGYECSSAAPKVKDCLEKGSEIAHWLTERFINPEHFCD